MADKYEGFNSGLTAPGIDAAAISPSDNADLPQVSRAIYVGGSGSLRVRMLSGAEVTLQNVQAGAFYPLRVRRVLSTGTSAQGLIAIS